jgi:hypothetical protein
MDSGSNAKRRWRRANEGRRRFIKTCGGAIFLSNDSASRESLKNLGDGLVRRGQRFVRSRAAVGLLLLVVTAHAFVAGATHFHVRALSHTQTTQAALYGDEDGSRSVPLAGDEAQCLLCRLQRSFVSDLQGTTLAVAPPSTEALGYDALRNVSVRASRSLLPSGRAPPSV